MFNNLNLLGSIDPSTILMGVNIFMLAFIVFGFLLGIKRGAKSSLTRLLFLVGIIITMIFVAPLISRALLNMDISSILGANTIDVGGETYAVTSLSDLIIAIISGQEEIATIIGENPVLVEMIQQIPIIIMNLFIFVIGFFVLKIFSWPIYRIIVKRSEKKKAKMNKNKIKEDIKGKKRILGGLIGIISGGLVALVIFVPIAGLSSIVNSYPEDNEWFSSIIPEELSSYMTIYEDSIIGTFGNFTNIDIFLFDALTTIRVDQLDGDGNPTGETYKFNFRKEIVGFSDVIDDAYHIVEMIKNRYDGTSETIDWNYIENTIDEIFELETANIIISEIFPGISSKLIDDNLIITDPLEIATLTPFEVDINNFYIGLRNRLSLSNTASVKTDVDAIVGVLRLFDEYGFVDIALQQHHNENEATDDIPLSVLEIIEDSPEFIDLVTQKIIHSDSFRALTVAGTNVIIGVTEEFINKNNDKLGFVPISRISDANINWNSEAILFASALNNLAGFSYDILLAQSEELEPLQVLASSNFEKIGAAINNLRSTALFGDVYINLFENLLTINTIQEEISEFNEYFDIGEMLSLLDTADWQYEFGFINDIISIAVGIEEEDVDYTDVEQLLSNLKDSEIVQYLFDGTKSYLFIEVFKELDVPVWAEDATIDMISNNSTLFTKIIEFAIFLNEEKEPGINNEIEDFSYGQVTELVVLIEALSGSTTPEHLQLIEFMNGFIQFIGEQVLEESDLFVNLYFEDIIDNIGAMVELYFVYNEIGGDGFENYDSTRIALVQNKISTLDDISPEFKLFLNDLVEEFFGPEIDIDFDTIDWNTESEMIVDLIIIVKDYHENDENLDTNLFETFLEDYAVESSLLDIFFQLTLNELIDGGEAAYGVVDSQFIVDYADYFALRIDLELYHEKEGSDPIEVVAKANNIISMLDDAKGILIDEEIYFGADHTDAIAFIDQAITHATDIMNEY